MATKTLTIMKDAYEILKMHKMEGESFTDVIKREFTKKRNIMDFAGAWSHLSKRRFEEIENTIKKARDHTRKSVSKKLGLNK